jgi:hypothetical protein
MSGQTLETARRINSLLDRIREELLDPDVDVLERCEGEFDHALTELEHLSKAAAQDIDPGPEFQALLGDEYKIVRRNLSQISALVRNAGAFYEAWARITAREPDIADDYAGGGRSSSGSAGSSLAGGQVLLHG